MSHNNERSEMVQSFMAITGSDDMATAKYWLEAANFNLDGAIDIFYSSSSASMLTTDVQSINLPTAASTQLNSEQYDGVMNIDDTSEFYGTYEDFPKEEDIRKPDIVKKQRLMDLQSDYYEFEAKKAAVAKITPVSTFACASDGSGSEKDLTLAKLFQAPHDIMTQGHLFDARYKSKEEGKWLLVNIQREEDFACHMVNRDLWSDEGIKEIINCGFLFWQVQNISLEGIEFCKNYKVVLFPHIAILDPRTGASIWSYTKKINCETFSEGLMDFLGSHPYPEVAAESASSVKSPVLDLTKDSGVSVNMIASSEHRKGRALGGNSKEEIIPLKEMANETKNVLEECSSGHPGFDPTKLRKGTGTVVTLNPSIPMIKILLKFPSTAGASNKPRTLSLPSSASVLILASLTADMMAESAELCGKKFELLLMFPKQLLSKPATIDPCITLSGVGINTDTAIIVQLI